MNGVNQNNGKGNNDKVKESYKKSLQLNPNNQYA